jgi:hypothetical protein
MPDRAALYTVSARPKAKREQLPLGDLDGAGTSLVDVLAGILEGFVETSAGGTVVRSLVVRRDGDDLFAIVQHGFPGVAADIVAASGEVRLRQTPDDLQLVRSGCLFRLPVAAKSGAFAMQVTNGRGAKELFERGIVGRFRARFPGLTLALDALAEAGVLREAVAADRVEKLQLVRHEQAGKRKSAAAGKWVATGETARIAVDVAVKTPGAHLQGSLLQRYLGGDQAAYAEIVEFGGITFDEAHVGIVLGDQTRRLLDLAHPEAGPPLRRALSGLELDDAGEPTEASLLGALRATLA